MGRIIAAACVLVLVGCGDSNQQKLEKCMADAGGKFSYMRYEMGKKMLCGKPGAWPECLIYEDDLKRARLEDEDRCVKLYK